MSADAKTWLASFTLASALVDYAPGLEQNNKWHSGAGVGVSYASLAWQVLLEYGYGINAARGRGNHTLGLRLQFDFRKTKSPLLVPRNVDRGFERVLERLPKLPGR